MSNFFEYLIENDLNPFILFSKDGKIYKYNEEADFLLSFVSSSEIFNLALNNAPKTFGFKKSFLNLNYAKKNFYALLVGYIDEEYIGIKLYKEICNESKLFVEDVEKSVNLFTILEVSKNSILANSNVEITEEFDPSIPDIKLNIDNFLKLLNMIFSKFKNSEKLKIRLFIKIGENIVFNSKKYSVCFLSFEGDYNNSLYDIHMQSKKTNSSLIITEKSISLEFPLIRG